MNEKTISSQRAFDGRLLKLDVLEVELDNGRRSWREVVRHPGAVAVWARMPDGRFVFVRQFRKAIESDLLEIVAGTRNTGEPPDTCALREVREETGYDVTTLKPLGFIHTAPGFCGERLELFFAELAAGGNLPSPDPDEALDVVRLNREEWEARVVRGDIHDAKTLAAWALVLARGL
ncbi:MAG: NUDIX hydrolase [Verrucomicrobia bacterium]|nr:NUDIX hydrolase [Verrucomicrobiota bacterium]MBU4247886.1 NUDIX hydrolase [Verrucomicrobiota bacterium]MBU4292250.1 NUDIX hydrolase [Verrucomicrobiota bacterium]MBU4427981.1 NUDIX hydrolase [Verrucomicrobiota bacterium]MBU4498028.1 NUDIX hydrolase [Verrucomicrobiota bacterium]